MRRAFRSGSRWLSSGASSTSSSISRLTTPLPRVRRTLRSTRVARGRCWSPRDRRRRSGRRPSGCGANRRAANRSATRASCRPRRSTGRAARRSTSCRSACQRPLAMPAAHADHRWRRLVVLRTMPAIARSRQRVKEFRLQHRFDEAAHARPDAVLHRIEPIIEEQALSGFSRLLRRADQGRSHTRAPMRRRLGSFSTGAKGRASCRLPASRHCMSPAISNSRGRSIPRRRQAAPRRDPASLRLDCHGSCPRDNPAHAVRGRSHRVKRGKTPLFDAAEARVLIDTVGVCRQRPAFVNGR